MDMGTVLLIIIYAHLSILDIMDIMVIILMLMVMVTCTTMARDLPLLMPMELLVMFMAMPLATLVQPSGDFLISILMFIISIISMVNNHLSGLSTNLELLQYKPY